MEQYHMGQYHVFFGGWPFGGATTPEIPDAPITELELGTTIKLTASGLKAKVVEIDGSKVKLRVEGALTDWIEKDEALRIGKVVA